MLAKCRPCVTPHPTAAPNTPEPAATPQRAAGAGDRANTTAIDASTAPAPATSQAHGTSRFERVAQLPRPC